MFILDLTKNGFKKAFIKKSIHKEEKKQYKNQSEIENWGIWPKNILREFLFKHRFWTLRFRTLKLEWKRSRHKNSRFYAPPLILAWPKSLQQFTTIWLQKSWKRVNSSLEIKNTAGQVLKNNTKNWMKNSDVLYLTSRSIEQCQPEHKQNHLKKLRS